MNVSLKWLVFLALMGDSCQRDAVKFELPNTNLTVYEGVCVKIECIVEGHVDPSGAEWFWMKNAIWRESIRDFDSEIVYSNTGRRPTSHKYAGRVTFDGNLGRAGTQKQTCSISICKLTISDSGKYAFRFVESLYLKTKSELDAQLTVQVNPCPFTFEEPSAVVESSTITLKCSTPASCPTSPWITSSKNFNQLPQAPEQKSITVEFLADWQDDGKEFSCQAKENKDQYFSPKISLTVEYAPKEATAKINYPDVTEGKRVTLTCSTRGRPIPSVKWFRGEEHMSSEQVWTINSITRSQQGQYHCVSNNRHGNVSSDNVTINVKFPPSVEISSRKYEFTEGDKMELECKVINSNPDPGSYEWLKAGKTVNWEKKHVVHKIQPEDGGSYTCRATNTAGRGTSASRNIVVNYKPRKTNISTRGTSIINGIHTVKVNSYLAIICNTDAHPAPFKYQWNCNSKHECSSVTSENSLVFPRVQRTDDMCYTCTATNRVDTGNCSNLLCIRVLYPPMKPTLIMKTEVREDQVINITCMVESFPSSRLTLTWTSKSTPKTQKQLFRSNDHNTLLWIFTVVSTDEGFYTCSAENSEGSNSIKTELVVKYSPKNVRIEAQPGRIVNEKEPLILHCVAKSNPPVTSFTWMKIIDSKEKVIRSTPTFTVTSASPSDSGYYSCAAANAIGTGKSQPYGVNVAYAPKHTRINRSAEQQRPDGLRFVTLTCSSQSFPPVHKYEWYREIKDQPKILLAKYQSYTVYSNQPGKYYCIAINSISEKKSEGVEVFLDSGFLKFLPYILAFLAVVFLLLLFLWYRRKKTLQQTSNAQPWWSCFCFMVPCGDTRRGNLVNECHLPEPCRSREDLLAPRSRCPQSGPRQPLQDSMSPSYITTVYCTVAQPVKNQGHPAQKPIQQRDACQHDDSVTYSTVHFGDKQKNKQAKAGDDVYAKIVKRKMPKKVEQGILEDYENIGTSKSPNGNSGTDTSEDEVELNYSQVMFKGKPAQQRASTDSDETDSDEEEEKTPYTGVKI